MKKSNIVAWLAVIALLVVGGIALFSHHGSSQETAIAPDAGAAPSPDFYNLVSFLAGDSGIRKQFVSTTTVACMIQNPINATSTFSMRARVVAATTTTTVLNYATSTNAGRFATSSSAFATQTVAANATGPGFHPALGSNNDLIGPGEWVQVGYGAGTTLPTVAQNQRAECEASFTAI